MGRQEGSVRGGTCQGDQVGTVEGKELHFSTMDRDSQPGMGALDALYVFFSLTFSATAAILWQRYDPFIFTSQH